VQTIWPTKKLGEHKKKDAVYFLLRDILSCFPTSVESNLISALNQHLISKELTRQIFKEEVQKKSPSFRILAGALTLQKFFLIQLPRAAFYEVIDVVPELRHCLYNDPRKTIRGLSAEVILRLFIILHFEFRILPGKGDQSYIEQFKEHFSKDDMKNILNAHEMCVPVRFIFERHGIDLGVGDEIQKRIENTLNEFYS